MTAVPGVPFALTPSSDEAWTIDEATVRVRAAPAQRHLHRPGRRGPAQRRVDAQRRDPARRRRRTATSSSAHASPSTSPSTFDAGVLLLWVDDRNWAKLCFEFSPDREPMIVSVVARGVADDANAFVVDGRTVWLRVSRIDHAYAYHASLDGTTWRMIRFFALDGRHARVDRLRGAVADRGRLRQSPSTTSGSPASAWRELRDGS